MLSMPIFNESRLYIALFTNGKKTETITTIRCEAMKTSLLIRNAKPNLVNGHSITLDDVTKAEFHAYEDWAHNKRIRKALLPDSKLKTAYCQLLQLYALGHKLKDQSFRNFIITSIRNLYKDSEGQNIPGAATISRAWSMTTAEDGPLRNAIIDIYFQGAKRSEIDSLGDSIPNAFWKRLVSLAWENVEQGRVSVKEEERRRKRPRIMASATTSAKGATQTSGHE